jgi:hypothetical protein
MLCPFIIKYDNDFSKKIKKIVINHTKKKIYKYNQSNNRFQIINEFFNNKLFKRIKIYFLKNN